MRILGFRISTLLSLVACTSLVACSVDDRILKRKRASSDLSGAGLSAFADGGVFGSPGTDAGSASDGRASGGTSGGSGGHATGNGGDATQGAGGGGGLTGGGGVGGGGGDDGAGGATGLQPVHGCLVDPRPEGCSVTLVKNSTFATNDVSNWTAEADVTEAWSASDSTDTSGSGSLSVKNTLTIPGVKGTALAGATQCVSVLADTTYLLAANLYVEPGQAAGSGAISSYIYDAANCQGRSSLTGLSTLRGMPGAWDTTIGAVHTGFNAQSMLVRLVAAKPYDVGSFELLFDDVRVYPAP